MMARKGLFGAMLAALAVLLVGPVGTAMASVSMETSPSGTTNNTTPSFGGTATDVVDPVTLNVYEGFTASGTAARTTTVSTGPGGEWSASVSPGLGDGTYTAQAEQKELGGLGETTTSTVATFTVDNTPPSVSINSVSSPSGNSTPTLTGAAGTAQGDQGTVLVTIYHEGSQLYSESVPAGGGSWSYASPSLPNGTYTAQATQSDAAGNVGYSATIAFTIETSPPQVALNQPTSPSKNTTPTFTGTASDTTTVTIDIYAGATAQGSIVSTAAANGSGGGWSSGQASPALSSGQYTAVAVQASSIPGNPSGSSSPVTFTVDTSSPTVTLNQPPSPSNVTSPGFSGAASDVTEVVVHIFNAGNSEVARASTHPSGGGWSAGNESPLPSGTYTAFATQESSLGNPAGMSNVVSFTVNTASPTVTLNSPAGRSNNATPAFSGTASDTTTVTVYVYAGSGTEGTPVRTLTAGVSAGAWSSEAVSPGLPEGRYTAIATQPSSLGNQTGRSPSVTFEVDAKAPTVVLNQPVSPSNNATPSFSGTASDPSSNVTVAIFRGAKAKGQEVASVTAEGNGGSWSSGPAGPLASGQYTAIARQPSSIGNGPGVSAPVTFTIETASPRVELTPLAKSPSNNTTPSFTGSASDTTTVTVEIYAGASVQGAPVSSATATGNGGAWASGNASPALASGQYTAVAVQPSSVGNPPGESEPINFEVLTTAPTLTLNQPPTPSNNTKPAFAGTASDTTEVVVRIYNAANKEVTKATATPSGHKFSNASNERALANGTYTATATEKSSLGNPEGVSEPVTFTVNTLPPAVTLNTPPSPSNNRSPKFTGSASDVTPVTVKIYAGGTATGSPVAIATGTPSGGSWSATSASELPKVRQSYTAVATEPSSIGNGPGESKPINFTVDPVAPTVVLNAPPSWTNDRTPSFTGIASDFSAVTINIYGGTNSEGPSIARASATGTGGAWSSGPVGSALADGQYTAVASQANRVLPNEVGTSERLTFVVDTLAPHPTLTAPGNGSSTSSQSVTASGSVGSEAGDTPSVTAQLFAGSTVSSGQAPVQTVTVSTVGKTSWSATFAGLSAGTYSVRAEQPDAAGNLGYSALSTFFVAGPAPAAQGAGPAASFTWFPASPLVGESVSLVSSATDTSSPIVAFAWDLADTGVFAAGGPSISTTFATPGNHVVQMRVTAANGLSSVATETIPVYLRPLSLMRPFPTVLITSSDTRSGIKLRVLKVMAGAGAQITVRCRGRGCPLKAQRYIAVAGRTRSPSVEFRRFERSLASGVVLEISVTKVGEIGKYTRLVVRRGRRPVRSDACLAGAATKPMGCPLS